MALQTGASRLFREELLTNFTIMVGPREFRVHKFPLMAVSDYFMAMFSHEETLEAKTNKVELPGLSPDAFAHTLRYIYTGDFPSEADYTDLLDCVVYLQMPDLIESVLRSCHVSPSNCLQLLSVFDMHYLKTGIEIVETFVRNNSLAVLDALDVERVTLQELHRFVDLFDYHREVLLLRKLAEWVQADYDKREQFEAELYGRIRFGLISLEELLSIRDTMMHPSIRAGVKSAIEYHYSSTGRVVHFQGSNQNMPRHSRDVPIFYDLNTIYPMAFNHKCIYAYNGQDKWPTKPVCLDMSSMQSLEWEVPEVTLNVNGFLMVYKYREDMKWSCYDPVHQTWFNTAAWDREREDAAYVYHKGFLYAIGGCYKTLVREIVEDGRLTVRERCRLSDHIDRFNFKRNTWEKMDLSPVPVPLASHGACSLDGHIYVAGGRTKYQSCRMLLNKYDPARLTWTEVAELPSRPAGNQLHVLQGKISYLSENFAIQMYSGDLGWQTLHIPFKRPKRIQDFHTSMVVGSVIYVVFNTTMTVFDTEQNAECEESRHPQAILVKREKTHFLSHLPLNSRSFCALEDYITMHICKDPIFY